MDEIKKKTAELIDMCEKLKSDYCNENSGSGKPVGEVVRLYATAQTHYEDAAMWAVKAATA